MNSIGILSTSSSPNMTVSTNRFSPHIRPLHLTVTSAHGEHMYNNAFDNQLQLKSLTFKFSERLDELTMLFLPTLVNLTYLNIDMFTDKSGDGYMEKCISMLPKLTTFICPFLRLRGPISAKQLTHIRVADLAVYESKDLDLPLLEYCSIQIDMVPDIWWRVGLILLSQCLRLSSLRIHFGIATSLNAEQERILCESPQTTKLTHLDLHTCSPSFSLVRHMATTITSLTFLSIHTRCCDDCDRDRFLPLSLFPMLSTLKLYSECNCPMSLPLRLPYVSSLSISRYLGSLSLAPEAQSKLVFEYSSLESLTLTGPNYHTDHLVDRLVSPKLKTIVCCSDIDDLRVSDLSELLESNRFPTLCRIAIPTCSLASSKSSECETLVDTYAHHPITPCRIDII